MSKPTAGAMRAAKEITLHYTSYLQKNIDAIAEIIDRETGLEELANACEKLVWALKDIQKDGGLIAQHGDALDLGLTAIAKAKKGGG